jgi:predicted nucleic acid-binding protein
VKRALIDANVILRYFTQDPPRLAEAAHKTFAAAQEGHVLLLLTPITVAEVVWVLESFYGYPKPRIAATVSQFLRSDGIEVIDLELLIRALHLYDEKNIDFADALLAAYALSRGINLVYSFDKHFSRIPGVEKLEPGSLPPRGASKPKP